MKYILSIIIGLILFIFLVFQPIRANLLAAIARHYQLDPASQIILFTRAIEIDPCNVDILNNLGDTYFLLKNAPMAAVSYGLAIACSPGNSLVRFKFGEAILLMGIDGRYSIQDALQLEPNNPFYRTEFERVTKLLSQSQ